jgi:hypothetical protein
MRKLILAAFVVTLVSVIASASASDLSCSPATASGCTYNGCYLCGPPGSICKLATIIQVGEAACAICDTVAERVYYGTEKPGPGQCVSTNEANFCTGCDWCVSVLYGCGGGWGFPPICDPPKGHGPIPQSNARDGVDLGTGEALSAPRGWILKYDRWTFLLLEYSGRSLFPTLAQNDEGLYFVQHPVSGMGWLAPSRQGMAQTLGYLLSSFNGDEAKIARNTTDVALLPPLPRSVSLVSAGKWSVEWRAVSPLAPFYFPMGEYPRLMYRGRPATLKDVEAAGLQPEPAN